MPGGDSSPEPVTSGYEDAHLTVQQLRSEAEEEAERVVAKRSFWRELPILVVVALFAAILIKTFFFQAFWIPSPSMQDTLRVNDRVLVNKLAYTVGDVARGDVVVFDDPVHPSDSEESVIGAVVRNVAESIGLSTPESDFIKRVIALPGETIEIVGGKVVVDGVAIDEPYLAPRARMPDFDPVVVPPGEVFVMGDNRSHSLDSRDFGPVPTDDIVGKAIVIIWPVGHWASL